MPVGVLGQNDGGVAELARHPVQRDLARLQRDPGEGVAEAVKVALPTVLAGESYTAIGRVLGVTRERVAQIIEGK